MRFQRTTAARLRRWAAIFLSAALGAGSTQAADVLPIGTIVLDVGAKTLTYGSLVEAVNPVGNNSNTCQLNQTNLSILNFSASGGNLVSIGKQKGALGIKTQGQDCAFAGANQTWRMGLGLAVGDLAQVLDWTMQFIVTDDAVFTLSTLDADGGVLQTYKVYTGKSACSPFGTNGVPRTTADNEFLFAPCTAQSNPNSNFDFVLGEDSFPNITNAPDWRQLSISVETGNVGVRNATLNLGVTASGQLTCENDQVPSIGAVTITPPVEIFQASDGVQCRRLPNRDGSACVAVPYVLQASCAGSDGTDCEIDFLHGDQEGVARDQFAFICEVWWPGRPGNFTLGAPAEPFLNRTLVSWGGLTTPLQPSDVPISWCPGITPLFSDEQVDEPNSTTDCGTALEYKLSVPAGAWPAVDGLTVSPNSTGCSLLEAYDDVLLVAPGETGDPGDQCDSSTCTQEGRQLACLMQERIVAEEDLDATASGNRDVLPGRIDAPADPIYRKGELIFIEGDIKMRSF